VSLAYRSASGHGLIDRQLHSPAAWTDDRERCRAVGIPDDVEFATEPQIAKDRPVSRGFRTGQAEPSGARTCLSNRLQCSDRSKRRPGGAR
jgi:hypothetical protein